jgi:DNA-binding NarL/FixJ family response regulator
MSSPTMALAAAQGEVLDALGIGVIACDPEYRLLAASGPARTILSRVAPSTPSDRLPEAIAAVLHGEDQWPVKVTMAGQTIAIWARRVELGWASRVVWLTVDGAPGDLDAALRRRWHLSRRQLDLVHQLRRGYRNQEIAAHLGLTCSTVKSYLSHLFDALGVRSRGEAIVLIERVCRGE